MKHLGHISITDKVVFVYYELPKPIKGYLPPLWKGIKDSFAPESQFRWEKDFYKKEMEEYNASKREVEVSNVDELKNPFNLGKPMFSVCKDGQTCEAEVNSKALITKII